MSPRQGVIFTGSQRFLRRENIQFCLQLTYFYLLCITIICFNFLFADVVFEKFSLTKFSNLKAFALWYFRFLKWREIFPGTSLIQIIKWHLFIFYVSANNFKALTSLFTGHNGTKLIIISLVLPYIFYGIELLKWNFEST